MILIFGGLLGFIAVAFGVFAEDGLRAGVSDEQFRFLMTAVRYNQVNALIIASIGLALLGSSKFEHITALKLSGALFIIGTMLFSFSIYLSVSFEIPSLVNITPVGGVTLMAAWLSLLVSGLVARRKL